MAYYRDKIDNYSIGELLGFKLDYYDENAKAKILEDLYRRNYNYRSLNEENKEKIIKKIAHDCAKGVYGSDSDMNYKAIFTDGYYTNRVVFNPEFLFFSNLDDKEMNFSDFVREANLKSNIVNQNNYIEDIALDNMVVKFMLDNCVSCISLGMDKNNKFYCTLTTTPYRMKNLSEAERDEMSKLNGMTFTIEDGNDQVPIIDKLIEFIKSYTNNTNVGLKK